MDAYFPKITLPSGKSDTRGGDGFVMIIKGKVMVVDTFDGGEATRGLIAWMKSMNVKQIDLAVATHAHGDHYGGFKPIVNAGIPIKEFRCYHIDSIRGGNAASREDSDNLLELIRWLQARDTRVLFVDHGSVLSFEDTTWKIYRDQPAHAADDDDNAWEYVNNGSLVLYSPELGLVLGGDGPGDLETALDYFGAVVSGYDISHHGNKCPQHDAAALKRHGCVVAWESCVERNGPGTAEWTEFGARRVVQQGIPVWMQDAPIYIHAENGLITFRQGNKTISKKVPYQGKGGKTVGRWVNDKGWKYQNADGSWAHGWAKLKWSKGEDWFYFDENGYCVYGWQFLQWSKGPSWFFFDTTSAAMRTGWVYDNGCWYYLDPETGAMRTGWVTYKGKKCYLEPVSGRNQGHCYTSCTATIGGKTYSFDKDGYATEIKADSGGNITNVSGKLNDIAASRRQFVIDIANYVRRYAPQYGICVYSPIIAQAIHESGWGESKLSAKYHNYFGLKCGTKWTGKSVNMKTQEEYSAGSLSTISANFRAYDSMEEGVKGYFEFIQLPRYANLKGITSPRQYLQNIKNDGYATGSQYVDHVMNTLNMYNLTQFDAPVSQPAAKPTENPIDVAISIAESYLGYHEGANNKTVFGDTMHSIQPRNMDKNAPWCDAFVDFVILQMCSHFGYGETTARKVLCGDFDDYTYNSVNLYKKAGRWSQTPHRGDQIFFGGSGHTGIVTAVESGIVKTIEGNKSDEVRRGSYSVNSPSIIGYGRPRYDLITGQMTAEDMPLIKRGSKCEAVKKLQQILNTKGYKLSVDGDFGPATEAAVKAYQKANGLEVDGEVGPMTWGVLLK